MSIFTDNGSLSLSFWTLIVANATTGLAVDSSKENTITNGNLYYFVSDSAFFFSGMFEYFNSFPGLVSHSPRHQIFICLLRVGLVLSTLFYWLSRIFRVSLVSMYMANSRIVLLD